MPKPTDSSQYAFLFFAIEFVSSKREFSDKVSADDVSKGEVVDTNNKSPVLGEGALLDIELLELVELLKVEFVELFEVELVELLKVELVELLEVELVELFGVEFVELLEVELVELLEVELLKVVEVGLVEVVGVDLVDFVATGSTTPTLTRAASITSHFLLTHFHLSFLKDGSGQTIPNRAPENCRDLLTPDTSLAAHLGHRSARC